jgi:undecaprenyl-diphosphatase
VSNAARRAIPHLLGIATGVGILVLCGALVDPDRIAAGELPAFRAINGWPHALYRPVWVVMQLGNIVAAPAAVLVALVLRRWRLAGAFALVGVGKIVMARVVKRIVERHRPDSLVEGVVLRGDASPTGLAFVSGHAVVAVGLATVLHPYLGTKGRIAAWALAFVVCFGRVFVGAHLPLDVVGGAGLGLAIGSIANLLLAPRPSAGDG